jgi:hypothetical protein
MDSPQHPLIATADAHDQAQSPLFNALPGELRNAIFRLALQQYVDTERLYDRETYWTRPGVEGPLRIDTALLRTCKRVWGETRDMLGKDLTLTFYLGLRSRAPQGECTRACSAPLLSRLPRSARKTCGVSLDGD